ncbi:YheC/YheD family protein [Paenibacillus cymbidii]|uniref:YheC/YheD family protein n=1 Tax=Paenibacillus cymbidii TaxID=1639034 RepID=UPI001080F770|nr:YheC/YheD family protein [Paenibacillus cymbidii]
MGQKAGRYARLAHDKWTKTNILNRNRTVKPHIPATMRYSGAALQRMLALYGMVYVKPNRGSHGRGVIRVEKHKNRAGVVAYSVHIGSSRRTGFGLAALLAALRPHVSRETYLIQRGINLLRHRGRKFDIRLVTQLDRNRRWRVTGALARVAHPGKAVTNGSQGATIRTCDAALAGSLGFRDRVRLISGLRRLGLRSARTLRRAFPHLNELGFDIAVDGWRRSWILEVNTRPEAIPFRKLADRTMYRRILAFRRLNGNFTTR